MLRSAIAGLMLVSLTAGAASAAVITTSKSNVKSPPTLVAPSAAQSAACTDQGGTYTKHSDGKWNCDMPVTRSTTGNGAAGH